MDYDKTLCVGDIITAYQKGIWRIEEIVPRSYGDKTYTIARNVKLLDANLKPVKGRRVDECGIGWCRRVDVEWLRKEVEEYLELRRAAALSLFGEELGL